MSTRLPESDSNSTLAAPIQIRGAKMGFDRRQELGEESRVADGFVEALAHRAFEVHAQNGAGCLIRRAHRQIGLERHHARRQARENHGKPGALRLHRLLAAAGLLAGPPQPLGHIVE